MLMADGHFGLQRLSKVDDPDDVSLLEGSGLFPLDDEYNKYVANVVAYSEEVLVSFCFYSLYTDEQYLENNMFKV